MTPGNFYMERNNTDSPIRIKGSPENIGKEDIYNRFNLKDNPSLPLYEKNQKRGSEGALELNLNSL